MSHVLVIDTHTQPCAPVHPAQARKLLSSGQAAVWRRFPFTIILTTRRLKSGLQAQSPPARTKGVGEILI